MSALFNQPRDFEDRLSLAFRGDAGAQKKATKSFRQERRKEGLFSRPFGATPGVTQPAPTGNNVFKRNLGGT